MYTKESGVCVCVWGGYLLKKIMKGGLEGPGGVGWRVQYEGIIQPSKNLMDKCKFIRLYSLLRHLHLILNKGFKRKIDKFYKVRIINKIW